MVTSGRFLMFKWKGAPLVGIKVSDAVITLLKVGTASCLYLLKSLDLFFLIMVLVEFELLKILVVSILALYIPLTAAT